MRPCSNRVRIRTHRHSIPGRIFALVSSRRSIRSSISSHMILLNKWLRNITPVTLRSLVEWSCNLWSRARRFRLVGEGRAGEGRRGEGMRCKGNFGGGVEMEMIKGLGLRHMCRLKRKKGVGICSKMWDSLGLHGVRDT
jgi:hypothetical protein